MKKKSESSSKIPRPIHVIIDGADKTGKSTVCNLLSKFYKIPVVKMKDMKTHFDGNPETASEVFNKTVQQFKDYPFILDRGYPTSLVYSEQFGRVYDFGYIRDFIKEVKPLVVILTSKKARKEDDLIAKHDVDAIRELYTECSESHGWEIIDCTDMTPIKTADEIRKLIEQCYE